MIQANTESYNCYKTVLIAPFHQTSKKGLSTLLFLVQNPEISFILIAMPNRSVSEIQF